MSPVLRAQGQLFAPATRAAHRGSPDRDTVNVPSIHSQRNAAAATKTSEDGPREERLWLAVAGEVRKGVKDGRGERFCWWECQTGAFAGAR